MTVCRYYSNVARCAADAVVLKTAQHLNAVHLDDARLVSRSEKLFTFYVRVFAIANPSVVYNVRAPYPRVETFGNISLPLCTLVIL